MGATILDVAQETPDDLLVDLVKANNVQILVLPYQAKRRWFGASPIDILFRKLENVDIYLSDTD
jgi:hypothetical protein